MSKAHHSLFTHPAFLITVALLVCLQSTHAGVRINEVMAANELGLTDGDGDFSDWIELYNEGPAGIELAGWTLSDDPDRPDRWTFPSLELGPDAYVVIFASGKDRMEPTELHANFKLASDGEYLALSNPEWGVVSAFIPTFPALDPNQSYGFDPVSLAFRPWRSPTPGMMNEEDVSLGPVLLAPQTASLLAEENTNFVISVQVLPNGLPIDSVTLERRIMHKVDGELVLKDDGISPDEKAGDHRFTGQILANTLFGKRYKAGEMLRWAFHARDVEGHESRLPPLRDGVVSQPEYFGTIVDDPSITSELPVLHWFAESPAAAVSTQGTRASAYFDGQFYDNIFVKRRGQSGAIGWPKPKLKFDFNPRNHFCYDPDRRLVEEFNLQSHFNDNSFMRENVAFAFFNDIGTPASDTRHWHIRLNGSYYGLFSFVEQVDQDFLRQQGLDPEGALYKANGFPSTLAKGVTPALYQKETRKEEPYDDLIDFVDGINGPDRYAYIMDHVNLPAMVNEMAGQSLIRNADRLTKNYYMYRDPKTDLWQRFPWDMDGAFSISGGLANENFASPLYGDSQHTQAPGQAIYQNFLLDAILDHKPTRQMYLRRLRTLIDTYLSGEYAYFHATIDERRERIRQEALLDAKEWGTGNIDAGTRSLKETAFSLRREELLETYGKDLVPESQTKGLELLIGEVEAAPEVSSAEYFQIINPTAEAIDLSGWKVSGAVTFEFPSGTVIPRKGTLFSPNDGIMHVVKDVRAFRERTTGPRGGQELFVIGPYEGKLSSRGETIWIHDGNDRLIVEHRYSGTGMTYASWAKDQFSEEALLDESISGVDANLYRYAFGNLPGLEIDASRGVRYRRIAEASDLSFTMETSNDLETWTAASDLVEQIDEGLDGWESVWVALRSGSERYVRIKVQLVNPN